MQRRFRDDSFDGEAHPVPPAPASSASEERIRALMEEIAALRAENAALRGVAGRPDPNAPVLQDPNVPWLQPMPYKAGMYGAGPATQSRIATPARVAPNQYMQPMPYKAPPKKRSPFE